MNRVEGPEGVEFDTVIYLVSDAGVEAVVALRGAFGLPNLETAEAAVKYALKSVPDGLGAFRVMTRMEITEYKSRDEESEQ